MLQGGEYHQGVHWRVQLDVVAGLGVAWLEMEAAIAVDRDLAEQVEAHQQVGKAEVPLAHFHQQVVHAVAEETVAQLLVVAAAVFLVNFLGVEHAAEAVMPAAGVGGDRRQLPAHVRIQAVTGGELGGVLALEAVGQV